MITSADTWKNRTTEYTSNCLQAINDYNTRVSEVNSDLKTSYGDLTTAVKDTTTASDTLAKEADTVVDKLGDELEAVSKVTKAYAD
jgi:hypothetical protein